MCNVFMLEDDSGGVTRVSVRLGEGVEPGRDRRELARVRNRCGCSYVMGAHEGCVCGCTLNEYMEKASV